MRELTELLKATKPFTVENRPLSWWHLLSTTAVAVALAVIAALPTLWSIRVLASIFEGLTLVRLFILYHDYQHGAIFQGSPTAKVLFSGFGIFILNPPRVWNRSHNYHHSKNAQIATASIGSFPVMTTQEYFAAPWTLRLKYRLARSPFTIAIGYLPIFLIGMCLVSFLKDPKRHFDSLIALVAHGVVLAALWALNPALAILTYLFPIFLACSVGGYLFYAQHNFPDMKLKPRTDWDFVYAALNSSSFMDGSPLMHWFTGNIGYHHVHHLNSRIPFYRLPEAMEAIPELQNPGRTSLRPMDVYHCIRLKLWDKERDRMVSFSEAHQALEEEYVPAYQRS
jgi:acyl-lipid omega-6 desaturase (Delta-12 desaturase)